MSFGASTSQRMRRYAVRMSQYTQNRFLMPHMQGNPIQPDLTRLPAHLREALHRPDPIRENEACGHLLTMKPPGSVPGARVRFAAVQDRKASSDGQGELLPPRLAVYIIDPTGAERLVQLYLDPEQARVAHEGFSAALADPRLAILVPAPLEPAPEPAAAQVVPGPASEVPPPFPAPVY